MAKKKPAKRDSKKTKTIKKAPAKKAAAQKATPKKSPLSKKAAAKASRRKKAAPIGRNPVPPKAPRITFAPEVVVPGLSKIKPGAALPEVAFYYPNPYWHDLDWARNMILFFDGIGMLIPNYMEQAASFDDVAVIAGLKEHNLFHVFQPENFMDHAAAVRLEQTILGIIESGALDDLPKDRQLTEASLSMSRMGFHVASESAERIIEALKKRNLAKDSEDGLSIPMHATARYLILVILAQVLRENGKQAGFDLLPATDVPQLVESLHGLLGKPNMPSADHVIALDMEAVGVDLGSVPIEHILAYRKGNREAYRTYARTLRLAIHELSLMPPDVQELKLEERQEEISTLAAAIRKTARKEWKKPASFLLSVTGAIWKVVGGDYIGASLAGGAVATGFRKGEEVKTGAYSYLFDAARKRW
jgi:hypothetical protein